MNHQLPNYIRAHRKRWALTQQELALLLGLTTQAAISKYEATQKRPGVEVLISAKTVFDVPCREMFPHLYENVERELLERAEALYAKIGRRNDVADTKKLRFLADLIERIERKSSSL